MSNKQHTPEPFGFFRAEPFGWTDCAETDEGAQPLFDQAAIDAIYKQRDELRKELAEYQLAQKDLNAWRNGYRSKIDLALKQRDELLALIKNDAFAISFQSMGKYRTALIASVKGGAQ